MNVISVNVGATAGGRVELIPPELQVLSEGSCTHSTCRRKLTILGQDANAMRNHTLSCSRWLGV